MARMKVILTILICLIVGAGCALPGNPLPDRVDATSADTNSDTLHLTEDVAESLRIQRAAVAAEEEVRRKQANESRYVDPVALKRIRNKRVIDSFLRSDPGRTKQLQELYEEYNKRASNPPTEDKLRNSLLAIPELSHSVNSAIAAAKIIRGHHRRLDISMEDAIFMYLTQDCNWDAENARSILERIEY